MPSQACFEADYNIRGRDSDCFSQCYAAALLSYLQETGLAALAETGLTRSCLLERYNAFWTLARVRYTLVMPILLGDVITVRMWSRDAHGLGLYRDYEILRNGVKIGESLALWMLADAKSRTLYPAGGIQELSGILKAPPRKKDQLRKIVLPDGLFPVQRRMVTYSQTDMNGHLNNSRYADLICDAVGLEKSGGSFVSSMKLSYLAECKPGCNLELSVLQRRNIWYVRGTGGDHIPRFEAEVMLCRP